MVVFAVCYSNYEPPEIDSLWTTRALAEAKAAQLNAAHGGTWEVQAMTVQDSLDAKRSPMDHYPRGDGSGHEE